MMNALRFDAWRAAFVVLAWIRFARGEEFFGTLGNQRLVFAVRRNDNAQLPRELERAIEFRVIDSEGAFVGQKHFE